MAQNPLQQFFRQPKIFVSLPSKGVYNSPGAITGDVTRLPVYGMTGMDEILMKTPDALLNGESVVKVIESCCPAVKDGWDVNNLDVDLVLTAIRIATFGNEMNITGKCSNCGLDNEYSIDLNSYVDHYGQCEYDNRVVLQDLVVTIKPLTYKEATAFSLRNFQLQQKLRQVAGIENSDERSSMLNAIYQDLAIMRNDIFVAGIESVEAGSTVVTERPYIHEWISNADSSVMDAIAEQIEKNQQTWSTPAHDAVCDHCGHKNKIAVSLDQANFFAKA